MTTYWLMQKDGGAHRGSPSNWTPQEQPPAYLECLRSRKSFKARN